MARSRISWQRCVVGGGAGIVGVAAAVRAPVIFPERVRTPNRTRPKIACLNTIESYFWGVYQRYCSLYFQLSLTLTHNEFKRGFLMLSNCKLREDGLSRDLVKLYSARVCSDIFLGVFPHGLSMLQCEVKMIEYPYSFLRDCTEVVWAWEML